MFPRTQRLFCRYAADAFGRCRFPFRAARPSNAASFARQEREQKEFEDAQFAEKPAAGAGASEGDAAAAGSKPKKKGAALVLDDRPFTIDAAMRDQLQVWALWVLLWCSFFMFAFFTAR